jgi:hypothetical protein
MDSSQNGEEDADMDTLSREDEIEAFEIRRDYRNIRENIAGFLIISIYFSLNFLLSKFVLKRKSSRLC